MVWEVRSPQDEVAAGGRLAAETFGNEILSAALALYTIDRSWEVARMMGRAEASPQLLRSLAIRGAHSIVDLMERRQRRYRKKLRRRGAAEALGETA